MRCPSSLVLLALTPGLGVVRDVRVVNDRAPDCRSLTSIVESVTRDCATDDARAVALYNFTRYALYHHAYPTEAGGISALKLFHVYGWSLCGGEHTALAALYDAAGWPWRYRGWSNPGHTTVEAFYGGRWHYLDTFLKFYLWRPAEAGFTIAAQEDLSARPELLAEQLVLDPARQVYYQRDAPLDWHDDEVEWRVPAFLVCGDDPAGVLSGVRSSRDAGNPRGWGGIRFDDPAYSTNVDLGPGYSLTLDWAATEGGCRVPGLPAPRHSCGDKDYRNCPAIGPLLEPYRELSPARSWSNGHYLFRPDLTTDAWLTGEVTAENLTVVGGQLQPTGEATLTVPFAGPYPLVRGRVECRSATPPTVEVSADGRHWRPAPVGQDFDHLKDSYRGLVRLRFTAPLSDLGIDFLVQHNQRALPYLAPGRNELTLTAADPLPAGWRLAVTLAWLPGQRTKSYETLVAENAEIARAHWATWSAEPMVVQTIVERLPAQLTIDVPTPAGQPVYPRMLCLRREILTPGQAPLPTPAPPTTTTAPADQLRTLPSPWTVGATPPVPRPTRPTRTVLRRLDRQSYVALDGSVFEHHFVKWLKDGSAAWVWLLGLPADLPPPAAIASARLRFAVEEAHDKADMEVAATGLTAPFEPGRPFPFEQLGGTLGSVIVKRATEPPPFVPPRVYELDLTRGLQRLLRAGQVHGLGVRIIPNRAVDDGWTVRFTPARTSPPELVLEVYEQP